MKYFALAELTHSDAAIRQHLDNTPDGTQTLNLLSLIRDILDPLREAWGRPIFINSGFRSAAVNKAVGGAKNSYHMRGLAADITTGNSVDNRRLFTLIQKLGLPVGELIGAKYDFKWLHVALKV